MSRTSIIPTAQTKANQATDFYLRADAGGTVNGNLTVEGNITLGAVNDKIVFPVSGEPAGQICVAFVNSTTAASRWAIGTSTAEAGANSGNNFELFSYDDAGVFLANTVQISRATSAVTLAGTIAAPNIATAANRVASASFVPDAITINPNQPIFTINAAAMPGLAALIANPAVNIIQLFSQFGIQTTAGQPKMNLGLTFQADGGGALLTNSTVCLGQITGSPVTSPAEYPYVLYANLVRGVHFTGATTQIVVGASADTTPNGAVITLLNNDDDAGTPTSPSVTVNALGMM